MVDIYNVIINDPVYMIIAIILAIAIIFTLMKKIFKFAVIIIAMCVLYLGYLYYIGEEIPDTVDSLIENVGEKAGKVTEDLLEKSENLYEKAEQLIKDKTD